MDLILVLGQDGKIHEATVKWSSDLSACDRVVALRRVGEREAQVMTDRMCPRCFAEIPEQN